jgi:hypothetical protein
MLCILLRRTCTVFIAQYPVVDVLSVSNCQRRYGRVHCRFCLHEGTRETGGLADLQPIPSDDVEQKRRCLGDDTTRMDSFIR